MKNLFRAKRLAYIQDNQPIDPIGNISVFPLGYDVHIERLDQEGIHGRVWHFGFQVPGGLDQPDIDLPDGGDPIDVTAGDIHV